MSFDIGVADVGHGKVLRYIIIIHEGSEGNERGCRII